MTAAEAASVANGIDDSQRKAAIVVGVAYLFAMAAAMFSEGYVRGTLIAADAPTTAQNIIAHTARFRAGVGLELLTFASDTTLITALYVILAPVNRHLALYASFLRIVAVSVGVTMAAHSFDVLRILSGAEYLRAFDADRLAALARLSLAIHGTTYVVVFVFLGLGSTVFGYLWLQSKYVPKALAWLGIVASFLLAAGSFAILLAPGLQTILYPTYMVPMFFFEVGMGIWLLVKGLRPSARTESPLLARRA
jgi:hypothetical protein